MSAPMVRALLAGTKKQTRRVLKLPSGCSWYAGMGGEADGWWEDAKHPEGWWHVSELRCRYGVPGDRLWARETWRAEGWFDGHSPRDIPIGATIAYEAGRQDVMWPAAMGKLRPSIFMPRWASRITLEVVSVRVERLQDISDADVLAEGTPGAWVDFTEDGQGFKPNSNGPETRQFFYRKLWESINGLGSWAANPWVWVVEWS
jgi:hypothetical protein